MVFIRDRKNGAFCLKCKDQSNFSIAIPDFLLNYENYNGSEKPKLSQSLAKNVLVEVQHLMGLCKNFLYIFHLFHYTINIIKKGATVLQNVSKTYLVYKNESGLSSVEAAAAAAATEA